MSVCKFIESSVPKDDAFREIVNDDICQTIFEFRQKGRNSKTELFSFGLCALFLCNLKTRIQFKSIAATSSKLRDSRKIRPPENSPLKQKSNIRGLCPLTPAPLLSLRSHSIIKKINRVFISVFRCCKNEFIYQKAIEIPEESL